MAKKLFPFVNEIGKDELQTDGKMSDEHQKIFEEDQEYCKYMIDYRRNSGWDAKARRGQVIYNVLQTMKPEDEISKIFIGYSRMIIDKGIEQMTEGEPDFEFEPRGPSDHMKTIIWKHLLQKVLSDSDYRLHQETFFRDYFVMGSAVFEVFIDYPQRTLRIPQGDGKFESIVVSDYRRPKVGVRAVNPMNCWRSPDVDTPSDVPMCLKRRVISWNQFAQEFGRCEVDGKKKYMNIDKISKGNHVAIYTVQDEIRDVYRIYARSFGNDNDSNRSTPPESELGILLLDSSLKIHEMVQDGLVLRSTGMNIPGICTLRWGTNFDKYDKNSSGDHSVYGMGLPERIEGEDTVLQTVFNMNIDNYRMANTVALNYKGSNADSYMDVDANRLYGGEFIDGEIIPQPLGIARIGDFQAMQESIDRTVIPSTAINHQQMVGDTSKTAFEFGQRIRMANRGAEQRLKRLENEVFKPVGELLLANSLTVLTVEDFEDMTEQEVEIAQEQIKSKKKTNKDFQNLSGKDEAGKKTTPQKRIINYIPLKGEKIRESFDITKNRQLDYNASFTDDGVSTNTLRQDPSMPVDTSYIPMVKEYVYPAEYIDQGIMPDVIVDSKRMLGDMKAQDVQNYQAATNFLLEFIQLTGYDKLDPDKIVQETLKFGNIPEDRMLKTTEGQSKIGSQVKDILGQFEQEANQQIKGTPQGGGVGAPTLPGQPPQPPPSALEQLVQ